MRKSRARIRPDIAWLVTSLATLVLPLRGAEAVPASTPPSALAQSYDVVIAGAGTGGIGAAVQAARLGATVLLLEEADWVGGQMLAAAVTAMDEGGAGNLVRGRGLYRELVERVEAYYRPLGLDPFSAGRYTNTRFEPRVGRKLVHALLAEAGRNRRLDLALRARVTRVHRAGHAVTGVDVEFTSPRGSETKTISSRVLVDATEWGDVLPLAGARYRSGNHTDDALDLARHIQDNTWTAVIKRYAGGVPPELRVSRPPPGYSQRRSAFAAGIVPGDAPFVRGSPMSWQEFVAYRGMPDSASPQPSPLPLTRTHLNFTNDYPCTVAYLESPAQRVATDRAMRLRTLQLLHYLQTELGVTDWSVADDEGFDSPYNRAQIDAWVREQPEMEPYRQILYHFSVIPYVRESRRLVGLHTLRAREISRGPGKRPTQFPTTICLGDYRLDLHGGRAAADLELDLDRLEDLEDAQPGRAGPFAIPMESLVPVTLDGFLAAEKNFSQTRLVNGATRMQPHTLNLGQAVGALAALAVRHNVPPRRIDPVLVQRALLAARSTLAITPVKDVPPASADWPAIQLVAVRGLLPLEDGRFLPQRPLNETEFARMLEGLGAAAPRRNAPITRAALADTLAQISGATVNLVFNGTAPDASQPITRSEAAQVIAEFLELRALGTLTGQPQRLAWTSVRPASNPVQVESDTGLRQHIRRLVDAQILTDADYWLENAVEGKTCDGARVRELVQRAARALEPQATDETALDVLLRARVITARDYWQKSALPGGRCLGRNVAALLRNLAAHPLISKRPPASSRPAPER